jgi:hypothetical protein
MRFREFYERNQLIVNLHIDENYSLVSHPEVETAIRRGRSETYYVNQASDCLWKPQDDA